MTECAATFLYSHTKDKYGLLLASIAEDVWGLEACRTLPAGGNLAEVVHMSTVLAT
ncbi:hypothetical protein DPMN_129902 [Dreissena polymorpha]|uniref:Uncharacterized protein n=1 Tax=Dreissena polymorpha TaxID=45954 RepID=A0A9D4H211_DREPO|nr:hypothetical protein DPMN_129902 [Dreissena polymorpha]